MNTTVTNGTVTIDEKVAFLQQPANYPYPVTDLKVKETHMSWVFLADDYVYKLKKPVRYRFFDHLALASRLSNSIEEIRINKQLANDIYVGVVPLVINETGQLQIEAKGEIVDWLVKMKRIPEKDLLDYATQHKCVDEDRLRSAAKLLADFYKSSLPVEISSIDYIRKLESEVFFNYNELTNPLYQLPLALITELNKGQMAFLSAHQSIIEARIANKKIIDAHGDLRPEHICLGSKPAIIDRLEFCKDLRVMDVAEELSFLMVECEMLNSSHVGQVFFNVYKGISNDNVPYVLMNFYKIKKACLRAYLVARHIDEPRYKDDPKWLIKANSYLKLAERIHQQYSI